MIEFFFAGDVVYNAGHKVTWNSHPAVSVYVPTDAAFPLHLRDELQFSADHRMQFVAPVAQFLSIGLQHSKSSQLLPHWFFLPQPSRLGADPHVSQLS